MRAGGHTVPADKIVSRYHASLDLLPAAIRATNRSYLFDNSVEDRDCVWLAEVTDGTLLELKADPIPAWFQAVLEKAAVPES